MLLVQLTEQLRSDLTSGTGVETFFKPSPGLGFFWTTLVPANDSTNPSLSVLNRIAVWELLGFIW